MSSRRTKVRPHVFTPDPDVPAEVRIVRGVRVVRQVCRCGLLGGPGDAHHTMPEPVPDVAGLAAGENN